MAPRDPDEFDGYRKWLGICEKRRPPTHYELLAISLDEDDPEVIRAAAEQRRGYVQSKRGLGHDAAVTEILYRIGEAETTLLNEEMRRDYDRQLNLFRKRRRSRQVDPQATRSRVRSRPGRAVGEDTGIVKTMVGIMAIVCVGFGLMAWLSFQMPWGKKTEQRAAPVPAPQAPPVVAQPQPAPSPAAPVPAAPIVEAPKEQLPPEEPPKQAEVEPMKPAEDAQDAIWKFWDVFNSGAMVDQAVIVSRDGVLVLSGPDKRFCLASVQKFSEMKLNLDFQFSSGEIGGNPFVAVASTLPNPDETEWTKQIPRGIEVKLVPNIAGQLVLPTADFKVQAKNRDPKDKRKINPSRRPTIRIGEWNTLEFDCNKDRTVTVKINGEVVNRLAKVESIAGHVIIWPAANEMRIRNVIAVSGGAETKLPFDNID